VLRYLGTAVNQSTEIAKKVKEDTGITIDAIALTSNATRAAVTIALPRRRWRAARRS